MDDSLVRATTTATSLDVEQDRGNIFKTQSKATPNESSSQGTDSGGGPKCQKMMGDTITQTRSENVNKFSNDPLLAGVNVENKDQDLLSFFIIAVQTPISGISILLAVGTPSTGSGNLYCQWELSPGSGNALCILFPT
nr:hypothetical protein [Tanacetum cinerariifolium]